jgi:hypothetical protein
MLRRAAFAALGLGVAVTVVLCVARAPAPVQFFDYHAMCEASTAVAVNASRFLVADDQDSILRLYERGKPEPISPQRDLAEALGVPKQFTGKDRKTDIEGRSIGNGSWIPATRKMAHSACSSPPIFSAKAERGTSSRSEPYRSLPRLLGEGNRRVHNRAGTATPERLQYRRPGRHGQSNC